MIIKIQGAFITHEKGVTSVDEKMQRNEIITWELYTTSLQRLVETTKWPKLSECRLMKNRKSIKNY